MRNLLIALACLTPLPAHADWQSTKWGMSPEEVILATGNEYEIDSAPKKKNELLKKGNYAAGQYEFDISFSFDGSRKLESVGLIIKESHQKLCSSLEQEVDKKYKRGLFRKDVTPVAMAKKSVTIYGNKEENLTIEYTDLVVPGMLHMCVISYYPYSLIEKAKIEIKSEEKKVHVRL